MPSEEELKRIEIMEKLVSTKPTQPASPVAGLTEGRIVHYVLNDGPYKGQHRPAIVVKVWRMSDGTPPENGCCQLQVFTDSDGKYNDVQSPVMWRTSVVFDENQQPGTWHWIEKA